MTGDDQGWCTICGRGHPVGQPCPDRLEKLGDIPLRLYPNREGKPPVSFSGPSTVMISFDPAKVARLLPEQRSHLGYQLSCLFAGELVAESEWTKYGLDVSIR